ncbi:putative asparagine synthetase [Streptomyces sp. NBRC 110611]|uniref:asparagine synthase (glutamine-hydrolyzing) n=1 Tax=Streptomyces sp. NBRC 110611 TaxID=1621259 RepID=UPI000836F11E|nr:asparagine synthase (glutamine-hydrolyzing) [Streptomyces sp. NBRC 110611]GAU68931.1 putative asparagine synthetase [Streptomyces sp. NBRC 110611]
MCGIAGWVDFGRDLRQERHRLTLMTETMSCRGPDAGGVWVDRHAALGHRRLAVIDIEGGTQPMLAEEAGEALACLTYSGEVYNFAELRQELRARGHSFRTRSDTEVVLRAYLEWGEGLAEKLNGMFAFAIWDVRKQELLLVRDRMGIKPLYYYPVPGGVLFGSEPKAVLAHPDVPRRVDADGLREVLALVKTPGQAVFAGLKEVRPGTVVRVRGEGLTERRYWQLTAREHTDDLGTTIRTVRSLLEDTVERQLVSDVPLCTLLSGGLDSSTITALAAKHQLAQGGGPVRSFSVDFHGNAEKFGDDPMRGLADAPFVRELAAHVGTEHSEILLESTTLADPEVRATVQRATDLPLAYWGDLYPSLYRLFGAVREQSTVALSGEAADELFGGYPWFRDPETAGADVFPWLTPRIRNYFVDDSLFAPELLTKLDMGGFVRDSYAQALAEAPVLAGEPAEERRMRGLGYVHLTRFVQALLDRKDRMSMATGLEVRVPFCDHRLVEYVFNVPWEMKSFDGREKSLLRAAAGDLLPESVRQRVKAPYPSTHDPAYEQSLRDELRTVMADSASPVSELLDPKQVADLLGRPLGHKSLQSDRMGMELALGLNSWLTSYDVTVDL